MIKHFSRPRFKLTALAGALVLSGILTGCGSDDPALTAATVTKAAVVETSAKIAFQGYSDSVSDAIVLKAAVDAFVSSPTTQTLEDAQLHG